METLYVCILGKFRLNYPYVSSLQIKELHTQVTQLNFDSLKAT